MQFPADIVRHIPNIGRMSVPDILKMCQYNRAYYQMICKSQDLWRALALRDLTSHPERLRGMTNQQLQRDLMWLREDPDKSVEVPEFQNTDDRRIIHYYGWRGYEKVIPKDIDPQMRSSFLAGAVAGGHRDIIDDYLQDVDVATRINTIIHLLLEALSMNQRDISDDLLTMIQEHPEVPIDVYLLSHLLGRAAARGDPRIFDKINALPGITNDMRDAAFQNIVLSGGVPKYYNYPDITHPHIIDTLQPYSQDRQDLWGKLLRKYTAEREALLRLLLTNYHQDINDILSELFEDEDPSQGKLRYLPIILEYATPEEVRRNAMFVSSKAILDLIRDYLLPDHYDQMLWNQARYGNNTIPLLAPYATEGGIMDAFHRSVLAGEDERLDNAKRRVLKAFLPFLTEDQLLVADRILRKRYNITLEQLREAVIEEPVNDDEEFTHDVSDDDSDDE